jgi:hypothetical protein
VLTSPVLVHWIGVGTLEDTMLFPVSTRTWTELRCFPCGQTTTRNHLSRRSIGQSGSRQPSQQQ